MPLDASHTRPPEVAPDLALRLYDLASGHDLHDVFLREGLGACVSLYRWSLASVWYTDGGRWEMLATAGSGLPPPTELLADALDGSTPARSGPWIGMSMSVPGDSAGAVLAVLPMGAATQGESVVAVARVLARTWHQVRQRERMRARIRRMERMLAIAADWTKTLEMKDLLERMAAESTQLLDAERASIFLRDAATRTLVGRPALGVENGELRIPEGTGVVGQVVRTGEPRRVGTADHGREIDHSVDKQLNFQTRSVLCVPLRGKGGAVLGAFELINRRRGDFTADDEAALMELASFASIALVNSQEYEHLLRSRHQVASQAASQVPWIGDSPPLAAVRRTIDRVAPTDLSVLLLGENGTGKEVAAQLIHYQSRRRHEPFVAVNCAALPDTLLESELFGHERGAFTDARESRAGKFELASGGTLLLDEIGDMSLSGQSKLLRVLEEKVVVRLGGSLPIPTDVRILAATNQNLPALVAEKKFRQDLFFRLTVVTIELPALRDRGEDVLLLAEFFLREFSIKARRAPLTLTSAARQRLLRHPWPGNIRELRNLMERLVYLATHESFGA
ncbi:MAG: sigma-54 interaction domain-containing protein, partial [Pirellulaceae bacterium]